MKHQVLLSPRRHPPRPAVWSESFPSASIQVSGNRIAPTMPTARTVFGVCADGADWHTLTARVRFKHSEVLAGERPAAVNGRMRSAPSRWRSPPTSSA